MTLAVSTRLRRSWFVEIALAIGDPRQAAPVPKDGQYRQAEARVQPREGRALRRW